ncbi:hypothetical protein [Edaphobacter flagellatus]|uniref:hypothetical protein n=1 Tax=Edaphobacter flagellatus TaxID=1933044 RepID=UPI0021B4ABDF|nr:hypothetical protein [Edaphobacter flagellatus]
MLINLSTWQWAKDVQRHPDDKFLDAIKARLLSDFDQTFEVIKTQKLLSRSRDTCLTEEVCNQLEAWALKAPLSGARRSKIRRHCRLTVAFQQMASSLRDTTAKLNIWALNYDDLCTVVLTSLELLALSLRQKMKSSADSIGDDLEKRMQRTRDKQFVLRDIIDKGLVIINEGKRRCAAQSDSEVGSSEAFLESIDVATNTESLFNVWDAYSFSRAQVSLLGKTIRVHKPTKEWLTRTERFISRSHTQDVMAQSKHATRFLKIHDKSVQEIDVSMYPTFGQLLASNDGKNLAGLLRAPTLEFAQILESQVSSLVDIGQRVRIGTEKFIYKELISAWASVYALAFLARIWVSAWHEVQPEVKSAFLGIKEIEKTTSEIAGFPLRPELFYLFVSRFEDRNFQDLFYKPLVVTSEDKIQIPISIIEISRFDRNLLHMIAKEVNESLAVKGRKPISKLRQKFISAGFKVILNYPLIDSNGNLLTDIDIIAMKDRHIFLFQCKVLEISDSLYELWKNEQSLRRAAAQMRLSLDNLDICKDLLRKSHGISGDETITPFILTNVLSHAGENIEGFRVVDFSHLENILDGAFTKAMNLQSDEIVNLYSPLKGKFPSAKELIDLIYKFDLASSPSPRPFLENTLQIGGWEIIIPARKADLGLGKNV